MMRFAIAAQPVGKHDFSPCHRTNVRPRPGADEDTLPGRRRLLLEHRNGRRVRRAPENAVARATGRNAHPSASAPRCRAPRPPPAPPRAGAGLRSARSSGARACAARSRASRTCARPAPRRRDVRLRVAPPACALPRGCCRARTFDEGIDDRRELLLVLLQRPDLLFLRLQLARNLRKRLLASSLLGLQFAAPAALLALGCGKPVAARLISSSARRRVWSRSARKPSIKDSRARPRCSR